MLARSARPGSDPDRSLEEATSRSRKQLAPCAVPTSKNAGHRRAETPKLGCEFHPEANHRSGRGYIVLDKLVLWGPAAFSLTALGLPTGYICLTAFTPWRVARLGRFLAG